MSTRRSRVGVVPIKVGATLLWPVAATATRLNGEQLGEETQLHDVAEVQREPSPGRRRVGMCVLKGRNDGQ